MGRKIPGKKHKGVKDPEKQQAKRFSELAPKINAPPKNIDDQDVPKSLHRLIKLKEIALNKGSVQKKKKKKKKNNLITLGAEQKNLKLHPKSKPEKIVPIFNQKPGESNYHFWNRVNRETQNFIKETEFETKFKVQVKRNPETGQVEGLVKAPKDELEELRKKHSNIKKKNKKRKTSDENIEKKSKYQKRKEKLLKKKHKKEEENVDEFETFKDQVQFGEIVHAPPELKLTKQEDQNVNRTRVNTKGLLLNSLLEQSKLEPPSKGSSIDRTGKRKNLPVGERRQLEKQQNDVIAAYRALRAQQKGESA